ncbi:DNA primase [Arthrospira platensis PCC 7345]
MMPYGIIGLTLLGVLLGDANPAALPPLTPLNSCVRENYQMKISPEFAARLAGLKSQEKIRVLVFLQVPPSNHQRSPRLSPEQRKAEMVATQKAAESSLNQIKPILNQYNGKLLAPSPSLLGTIPVEITVAGVYVLSQSNAVKSIIEDQDIN